jgi:hypothetical protein
MRSPRSLSSLSSPCPPRSHRRRRTRQLRSEPAIAMPRTRSRASRRPVASRGAQQQRGPGEQVLAGCGGTRPSASALTAARPRIRGVGPALASLPLWNGRDRLIYPRVALSLPLKARLGILVGGPTSGAAVVPLCRSGAVTLRLVPRMQPHGAGRRARTRRRRPLTPSPRWRLARSVRVATLLEDLDA